MRDNDYKITEGIIIEYCESHSYFSATLNIYLHKRCPSSGFRAADTARFRSAAENCLPQIAGSCAERARWMGGVPGRTREGGVPGILVGDSGASLEVPSLGRPTGVTSVAGKGTNAGLPCSPADSSSVQLVCRPRPHHPQCICCMLLTVAFTYPGSRFVILWLSSAII
jgi:hypothetical protein